MCENVSRLHQIVNVFQKYKNKYFFNLIVTDFLRIIIVFVTFAISLFKEVRKIYTEDS